LRCKCWRGHAVAATRTLCCAALPAAGDIDPAIVPFLLRRGMSVDEADDLMNKRSGFLGMAGALPPQQTVYQAKVAP
jgi:hypothetical protein